MRKLTGAVFQSLDGVMQSPGGPDEDPTGDFRFGGWVFHFWDDSLENAFSKVISADYDLLLGRRTYDIFAAYWPYNLDNPIGEKFQRIDKYVLTHSQEPLCWDNSHRLSGSTPEVVSELKRTEGRDLLIQGSSTLYEPLLAAGLIDNLIIMTFPLILGSGKKIFKGNQSPGRLRLIESHVSNHGVAYFSYEPAGEVPTGSFATKDPSSEELQRRASLSKTE